MFAYHFEGGLQTSRRRSLFTLASSMIIFSALAVNLPQVIPLVKATLTDKTVGNLYLVLINFQALFPLQCCKTGWVEIFIAAVAAGAASASVTIIVFGPPHLELDPNPDIFGSQGPPC